MIWQKNPFAVVGRLSRCWLIASRVPVEAVRALVPAPLELVTHGGFAFWNVVICRLEGMRPIGIPAALGLGFWHVAHRLIVRTKLRTGEEVAGLYFVRSEVDQPLLAAAGDLLTDFHFNPARVQVLEQESAVRCAVAALGEKSRYHLLRDATVQLAYGSPFASLEEAAAFLKYTPIALSPHGSGAVNILRVERDEQAWRTRLLGIEASESQLLQSTGAVAELAFEVEPLDYHWRRGEVAEVQP